MPDGAQFFTLVSQAGMGGLAVYLVVWGLPNWIADMRREREADRATIQQSQAAIIEAFQREQKYEREQCAGQFERMMQHLIALCEKIEMRA